MRDTFEGYIGYAPIFDLIYTSDYMADNFPTPEQPAGGGDGAAGGQQIVHHHHPITGVEITDAKEAGRFHLVDVEYTDGLGVETDQLLEIDLGIDGEEIGRTRPALVEDHVFDAVIGGDRGDSRGGTL